MKIPPLNELKMVSDKRNPRKQESFLFNLLDFREYLPCSSDFPRFFFVKHNKFPKTHVQRENAKSLLTYVSTWMTRLRERSCNGDIFGWPLAFFAKPACIKHFIVMYIINEVQQRLCVKNSNIKQFIQLDCLDPRANIFLDKQTLRFGKGGSLCSAVVLGQPFWNS